MPIHKFYLMDGSCVKTSFLTPTKKKILYTALIAILFILLFFGPLKIISFVPLILGSFLGLVPISIYQYHSLDDASGFIRLCLFFSGKTYFEEIRK